MCVNFLSKVVWERAISLLEMVVPKIFDDMVFPTRAICPTSSCDQSDDDDHHHQTNLQAN